MKMRNVIAIVGILFITLQSCSDNDSPTLAQIDMNLKAVTTQSSISTGRTASTGLEFTDVIIGVVEIELETAEEDEMESTGSFEDLDQDGEDDNEEVEYEGRFVVDLINGTSTPALGLADLAPGVYEEVEVEMDNILDGGHTILIAFNYTPDGAVDLVSYEYTYDEKVEFELESDLGFSLTTGSVNQILVLMDLDAIFSSVDLNTASVDADGKVRINKNTNIDLANAINDNLLTALDAGEDDDEDGVFDND